MNKYKSVALRFLKGFVAAGLASVGAFLAAGVTIKSVEDLKALLIPLAIAFVTGGLLSIEKLVNWTDAPPAQ